MVGKRTVSSGKERLVIAGRIQGEILIELLVLVLLVLEPMVPYAHPIEITSPSLLTLEQLSLFFSPALAFHHISSLAWHSGERQSSHPGDAMHPHRETEGAEPKPGGLDVPNSIALCVRYR
jgi:hypothetical protein